MTVREEKNHLNGIIRFITDNRKTREKYKQRLNRTKETVTTVKSNNVLTKDKHLGDENGKSYAEAVKYNRINISNDTVNLSEIYNQLLEATSKAWTQTMNLDPKKPGPSKTWTLKNLDSENSEL